jgi:hypothetical protein
MVSACLVEVLSHKISVIAHGLGGLRRQRLKSDRFATCPRDSCGHLVPRQLIACKEAMVFGRRERSNGTTPTANVNLLADGSTILEANGGELSNICDLLVVHFYLSCSIIAHADHLVPQ